MLRTCCLIQQSTGSGKTNTIAWTSHRLSSLHDKDNNAIFDSVIVVTDRKVLDKQLQNGIYLATEPLSVPELCPGV